MTKEKTKKKHIIFFHGIGDNHKNAEGYVGLLHYGLCYNNIENVSISAHKYPKVFQRYLYFLVGSLVSLAAAIITPIVVVILSLFSVINAVPTAIAAAIASTFVLTLLSVVLLTMPVMNTDKKLIRPAIEKIKELKDSGVAPEDIILLGYSFGGTDVSELLKHYRNEDVKLGGAIFYNTFSSFENVIKHFPLPQTKFLSMLPSSLLNKMLKKLDLEYDIVGNIKNETNIPIVVINNNNDQVVTKPMQLATMLTDEVTDNKNVTMLKHSNKNGHLDIFHNLDMTIDSIKRVINSQEKYNVHCNNYQNTAYDNVAIHSIKEEDLDKSCTTR
ncbi:alpha/beta hydrolase [Wolbachia endosymbiont of Pentidionis agamae]|uniref:alpha/beta hydrolase n=1 Tax=Wolbachia endosymbiont of Pentidionis agamae TaxID=3110435 RepID=UPI002FD17D7E